jgi:DNA-directed RNA polymerase specialized sigma24 family protein
MLAMATASDDDNLLCAFAAGDAEAFGTFYRRHLPAVLGFFLRRTGDPELTADLTAEAFAAALLAAERYRPGERPALAWLYGIAAHKLADSRRRGRCSRSRQPDRELGDVGLSKGVVRGGASCDPGRRLRGPAPVPSREGSGADQSLETAACSPMRELRSAARAALRAVSGALARVLECLAGH